MRALLQQAANRLHAIEDHLTVRTQIAAAVAAMSIVLVGTLAAGAALISYRNTAALVESSLAGTASMASGRLDRFMATRQQEMKLFAELQPMQPLWQGDPAALRNSLEELQRSFSEFVWIGFADVDGNVVAGTGGLLQGKSVSARPWFKQGLEKVAVGDVHEAALLSSLLTQRANNEPYRFVDIAVPVRDAAGKLLGVLGGHLDWDWAGNLINDVEANDNNADSTLSIISKGGMVLLGPQKETIRYAGDELAGMLKAGVGAFRETRDGQQMLTAFHVGTGHRDYLGLNWIVTASQPASVALAAAIASAKRILAIGGVTALIALSLAVLVSRRIAAPIIAITREADRIGRAHGPTMLARQSGSAEVVQLSRALRSLLRRIGMAEERTKEAELRASENAMQLQHVLLELHRVLRRAQLGFLGALLGDADAAEQRAQCARELDDLGGAALPRQHGRAVGASDAVGLPRQGDDRGCDPSRDHNGQRKRDQRCRCTDRQNHLRRRDRGLERHARRPSRGDDPVQALIVAMSLADMESRQHLLAILDFPECAGAGFHDARELVAAVADRLFLRPQQDHAAPAEDRQGRVGVAIIGFDVFDQVARPVPIQVTAEYAEQIAIGVTYGDGDVDEAVGFVVGALRQQRRQQHRLMHVADGHPFEPLLEPGALGHGFALEEAAGGGDDVATYVGKTNPGEFRKRALEVLQRTAQSGRIPLPQCLHRLHLCEQLHLLLARRHKPIEPA